MQIAAFTASPVDSFTANINVQVHQKANFDNFVKLTETQLEALHFEILSTREVKLGTHRGAETVYRGEITGIQMKFMALAAEDGDRVILVTATSLESRFAEYESAFKTALSSFKFDK